MRLYGVDRIQRGNRMGTGKRKCGSAGGDKSGSGKFGDDRYRRRLTLRVPDRIRLPEKIRKRAKIRLPVATQEMQTLHRRPAQSLQRTRTETRKGKKDRRLKHKTRRKKSQLRQKVHLSATRRMCRLTVGSRKSKTEKKKEPPDRANVWKA